MRLFFWLQASYCVIGIGFFVNDLFGKISMGTAMIRAFIWPYAQWPLMKLQALRALKPVLALFQ
ncbi:MAG: hypothetical protein SFV21_14470 [Rhodospirillaceae bacterium]|nr:hypothetical protein [Rhodospirillaceae bacterium]